MPSTHTRAGIFRFQAAGACRGNQAFKGGGGTTGKCQGSRGPDLEIDIPGYTVKNNPAALLEVAFKILLQKRIKLEMP